MARAQLAAVIGDFETIVRTMRKLGVVSWGGSPVGDLVLGPEPGPRLAKEDKDPKAARRAYYSEVFGRAVTDPELENLP